MIDCRSEVAELVLPPGAPAHAWHAARTAGIGASDALTALGLSPWATPYELWLEKTGRLPASPPAGRMAWGHRLEPVVADWFTAETGLAVAPTGTWRRRDAPWALCNPDRFVADGSGLEIKTVSGRSPDAKLWRYGVPDYPHAQAQWSMAVLGYDTWWTAALVDGADAPHIHLVRRDQELIDDLWAANGAFWREHVLADVPPPVDGSTITGAALDDANHALIGPRGETDLGVDGALLVMRRRQLKDRLKTLTAELSTVENNLKALLGSAEYGLVAGRRRVRYARRHATRGDDKRLRAEHPDAWNAVARTIGYMELREVTK